MPAMGLRWLALPAVIAVAAAAWLLKPDNGLARDLSLIGDAPRGGYLITVSGCDACHTDHAAQGGFLAGGAGLSTPFGTFYPPNITPDRQSGIGTWSLHQFSDALSNGDAPHENLYLIFPYTEFTLMNDQDVVDLYAAVMAAPADPHQPPSNQVAFPFNLRLLLSPWKNLFFSPHRYQADPAQSAAWNRGAYLVNALAHCVACHSPLNALGAVSQARAFTGNPFGGTGGKALAITSLALLADGYTVTSLTALLKTGITPSAGTVGDQMAEVVQRETSHWTEDDLAAVSTYLMANP